MNTVFVCHSPFDLKAKYPRMVPFLSLSLYSLFSIPGNPIYLNSLNETVSKSLLIISIKSSNSLRISLICSNGTVTMFPATNKLRKMLSKLLYIFVKLTIQAVQVYNI